MRGTFSEEALLKFSELVSILDTADFTEGETYDFTRCVRPDGSSYGTGGKCRKGSEQAKDTKEGGKSSIFKPGAQEKIERTRKAYTDAVHKELAAIKTGNEAAIAKAKAETKKAFQAYKKEHDSGWSDSAKASFKARAKEKRQIKREDDKAAAAARARIAKEQKNS